MCLVDFQDVYGKIVGIAESMQSSLEDYLVEFPKIEGISKVILFGSSLSDRCTPESDLDFVVVYEGNHRRDYYNIMRQLREKVDYAFLDDFVGCPAVDYVNGNIHGVFCVARERGVVIYDCEQGVGRFLNKSKEVFERSPRSLYN